MWLILIIIGICIGVFIVVKRVNQPIEDNNLELLNTQQRRNEKESTGRYLSNQKPSENNRAKILNAGIKKIYRLDYDGKYDFDSYPFEIVGEASYQANIKRFAISREGKGCFSEVEARILRDLNNSYDKNACKVEINGLTVGYFSRNHAESWVKLLGRLNMSDSPQIYVKAVIVGGGSKEYSFGVRLDIPSRVANSANYIKLV